MHAYLRLIRFDKPIGTLLLLWPTYWALWVAYQGIPPMRIFIAFSLGVFLTRAAGCAINDFADSDFDGAVKRTSTRPLVTGEVTKKQALLITALLSLAAFLLAVLFLQPLTILWSVPALFIFVSYPFFKRFFPIPQMYLAIAFSFGILMAFIEAENKLTYHAWLIFAANYFWVLAYDTIYALVDIDDDLKIGIKTSAITFGRHVIGITMGSYCLFIILSLILGVSAKFHWPYYLGIMIISALIVYIYTRIKDKERMSCFKAFLFNNYIGLVLFLAIVVNYLVYSVQN